MPGWQIVTTKLLFDVFVGYPAVFVPSIYPSCNLLVQSPEPGSNSWWAPGIEGLSLGIRCKPPRFVAEQCLRRLVIGGESGQVCVVFFCFPNS